MSAGPPAEKAAYADAEAAYAHLTGTLHIDPKRIISYGRSVGNGASIDLASRSPVGGLIVQSGFTSAFVVLTKVPLIPFDKFKNISKIKNVRCPVLVVHGRNDNVIPFRNGERLFEAAPGSKSNYWVEKAGHNDLEWVAGEELFERIKTFSDHLP